MIGRYKLITLTLIPRFQPEMHNARSISYMKPNYSNTQISNISKSSTKFIIKKFTLKFKKAQNLTIQKGIKSHTNQTKFGNNSNQQFNTKRKVNQERKPRSPINKTCKKKKKNMNN